MATLIPPGTYSLKVVATEIFGKKVCRVEYDLETHAENGLEQRIMREYVLDDAKSAIELGTAAHLELERRARNDAEAAIALAMQFNAPTDFDEGTNDLVERRKHRAEAHRAQKGSP